MKVDPAFIEKLEEQLNEIDRNIQPRDEKLGEIGEAFVKECMKYYLWERDYRLRLVGNRTFTIRTHFKKKEEDGIRGIDLYLKIRVNGWVYKCFIEVKNWAHYPISDNLFNDSILDRFKKHDRKNRRYRILIMNKRNVNDIENNCKAYNIHIIPLKDHVTSQYIAAMYLEPIVEAFLDDFSRLFDDIINNKIQLIENSMIEKIRLIMIRIGGILYKRTPAKKAYTSGITKTGRIKEDIRKGISPKLIAKKHNTSVEYVNKVKSLMKSKDGEKLVDSRTKEAKIIQYKTMDEEEL